MKPVYWYCGACKHYDSGNRPVGEPATCKAFPDGIPRKILIEGFDHRKPFKGDNGIRFELAPGHDPPPEK